jgi:hypothetical protein
MAVTRAPGQAERVARKHERRKKRHRYQRPHLTAALEHVLACHTLAAYAHSAITCPRAVAYERIR